MAHHKSALKRIRQAKKRTFDNKVKKSKARTVLKSLREAIENKDQAKIQELIKLAQSKLARLVKSGIIKKNTAARTTSRLAKQAKSI